MKHSATGLTVLFLLGLTFPFTAYAQYSPQFYQNGSTSTTLAELKTDDAEDGAISFILLGDGRFRLAEGNSITRQHNYPAASTNYTSKAFFVERYKSDPPTAKTTTVTTGSGSSTFANPEVQMNSCVRVGASWSPSPANEFYTILSFTNNCSTSAVSGKIYYYFNSSEQSLSTSSTDLLIYNAWISNASITSSNDTSYTSMLEANYTDLEFGEIRHIYLRATVPSSMGVGVSLDSRFAITGLNCCSGASTTSSLETTKYPHDPNNKTVDKEWVCAKNMMPHELNYKISFHNDGEFFANDIFVYDTFEVKLVPNTANLRGSSAFCVLQPSYPSVMFHFPSIMLPGLNQTTPHLYTYEETLGDLTFSINTITCLPHYTTILNQASIVFDSQAPISTTIAETVTDETSCPLFCPPVPLKKPSLDAAQFSAQPNPFSDLLALNFTTAKPWKIQIFDTQGRQIFQQSGEAGQENQQQIAINASNWSTGIYFVRLQDGDQFQTSSMVKM